MDALLLRFGKKRPAEFYRSQLSGSKQSRSQEYEEAPVDFHARTLPDLTAFQFKPSRYGAEVYCSTESTKIDDCDRWLNWIVENGSALRRVFLTLDAIVPPRSPSDPLEYSSVDVADYGFAIHCDAKKGIGVTWTLYKPETLTPVDYRDFLTRCLVAAELEREVRFLEHPLGFRVVSDVHNLEFTEAKWGDYDPCSLTVKAPDLPQARQWHHRAVLANASVPVRIRAHLECRAEQYTWIRSEWNPMSRGWQISLNGNYSTGFDPFEACLPSKGALPLVYPLLEWDAGGVDSYYQCDLVAADMGRRLQIITNINSGKKVIDRLRKAEVGIPFHAVDLCW